MGSNTMAVIVFLLTAPLFFELGAYYEHNTMVHRIRVIIRNDSIAFPVRQKLYNVFKIYRFEWEPESVDGIIDPAELVAFYKNSYYNRAEGRFTERDNEHICSYFYNISESRFESNDNEKSQSNSEQLPKVAYQCKNGKCENFNLNKNNINMDAWSNMELYVRFLLNRFGAAYVCIGPWFKNNDMIRRNPV